MGSSRRGLSCDRYRRGHRARPRRCGFWAARGTRPVAQGVLGAQAPCVSLGRLRAVGVAPLAAFGSWHHRLP